LKNWIFFRFSRPSWTRKKNMPLREGKVFPSWGPTLKRIANEFTTDWIPAFAGMTFLNTSSRHARAGKKDERWSDCFGRSNFGLTKRGGWFVQVLAAKREQRPGHARFRDCRR
jgi:hypothetical protein